jgi:hypothetical protein
MERYIGLEAIAQVFGLIRSFRSFRWVKENIQIEIVKTYPAWLLHPLNPNIDNHPHDIWRSI